MTTRILAGTCGFAYRAWKGPFYPADLPAPRMLAAYAARLPTVEVDATFYHPPDPEVLAGWYRAAPRGFLFALKAPREITHERRLVGIADAVRSFHLAAAELEEKLGPLLFQLPPNLRKDLGLLRDLLDAVPRGGRTAIEFRNASWRDDAVLSALRDARVALAVAEAPRGETAIAATGRFGYFRLWRPDHDRRSLARWADRIAAQGWDEAFVYFRSAAAARAPALALELARLVAAG